MIDIDVMIRKEIENGYGDANAQAKVCQDLILKAISSGNLNKNVTIKGGVVMRSKEYILDAPDMREKTIEDIYQRILSVFQNNLYLNNLESREVNWLDEKVDIVLQGILDFIKNL